MPTWEACVFNSHKALSTVLSANFIARMISWTLRGDSPARLAALLVCDQVTLVSRVTHLNKQGD
jgi:hypothetical protein